jgi:gliding motility-associated-like protein
MKKILLLFILIFVSFGMNLAQSNLVVNGGYINLNSGTSASPIYLVIDNSDAGAINNLLPCTTPCVGNGGIISEGEFNVIQWKQALVPTNYLLPFSKSNTDYIPFTFSLSAPAVPASTYLRFSTEPVSDVNLPLPSDVSNLNICAGDGYQFVDRFWHIGDDGATTRPEGSFVFTYLPAEYLAPNTLNEAEIGAGRFNTTLTDWTDMAPIGNPAGLNTTTKSLTTPIVNSSNLFRTWSLLIVTPTAPIVGTITQPTCAVATASVDLSGLPAVGAWTVTSSPGGFTLASSGTTGTITGLTAGVTYTFTVLSATGCTSVASGNAIVNALPVAPTAPIVGTITQPTCAVATGSVDLSGLPAVGAWTVTSSPGGFTLASSGTTGTITGLTAGVTYTFTVENASGCTSVASGNAIVTPQPVAPTAPIVGTITQPTCAVATASVDLSGLPAVGAWTVTSSPGGFTLASSGTTGTITGLTAGVTYTFTVLSATGCTSVASGNAIVTPQPVTPTAPIVGTITQPTCAVATGSVDLSGLPAVGAWTVTSSPGGFTLASSGTTGTITGLTAGVTYTFTVENASGCTSIASGNAIVTPQPVTPTAPIVGTITQPTCAVATASVDLSGLPAVGAWTVTSSPGGFTLASSGTTGTITGLTAGVTYTFTVLSATGCTSVASGNAIVNALPVAPTAPIVGTITQPTCAVATGSVDLSGLPAVGAWTVTSSPGGFTLASSGTTGTITGLTAGVTYTFTVENASGCTSVASGNAIVTPQPVTPTAPIVGTITQPTCAVATASVDLSGLPAVGAWTVTSSPGGFTLASSGTTGTITGLTAGVTYTFTVENASGCTSIASGNAIVTPQPVTPTAPIVGTITQPTCAVATASVDLSGLPAVGAWTVTSSPGGFTLASSGTTGTITGLTAGVTYTFTVENASGCTSIASGNAIVTPQPVTPTAPIVGTITQPTCAVATGSVDLSGLPAVGAWTVTSSPGGFTLASSGTTGTITGLTAGVTYTFTVENASGCTSIASGNAIVTPQPVTPTAPIVGTITQPTCAVATASVDLSGLPAVGAWTVTSSPGGFTLASSGTTGTITGLTAGVTYTFTVENASGCTSIASGNAIVTPQPVTPTAPIVGTITQPTCAVATGSVDLSGLPAVGAWTVTSSPGGFTLASSGTTGTITGLTAGVTYTFTVENASGCTSTATSTVAIDNQPSPTVILSEIFDTDTSCIDGGLNTMIINASGLALNYQWYENTLESNIGGTMIIGAISNSYAPSVGVSGTTFYYCLVTGTCGSVSSNVSGAMVVIPTPSAPLLSADTNYCSFVTPSNITAIGSGGLLSWALDSTFSDILHVGGSYMPAMNVGVTTYYVQETLNGCSGWASSITISIDECGLEIPTAFSPNGDLNNDTWELTGIDEKYPKNIVSIYNRWGNLVFQSNEGQYENNAWDGTYQKEPLPVASYYFIIEYNDANTSRSEGTVTIIRNK